MSGLATNQPLESTDISFKLAPRINASYDPFSGVKFDPKQADDIVSKVAKGKQGN